MLNVKTGEEFKNNILINNKLKKLRKQQGKLTFKTNNLQKQREKTRKLILKTNILKNSKENQH